MGLDCKSSLQCSILGFAAVLFFFTVQHTLAATRSCDIFHSKEERMALLLSQTLADPITQDILRTVRLPRGHRQGFSQNKASHRLTANEAIAFLGLMRGNKKSKAEVIHDATLFLEAFPETHPYAAFEFLSTIYENNSLITSSLSIAKQTAETLTIVRIEQVGFGTQTFETRPSPSQALSTFYTLKNHGLTPQGIRDEMAVLVHTLKGITFDNAIATLGFVKIKGRDLKETVDYLRETYVESKGTRTLIGFQDTGTRSHEILTINDVVEQFLIEAREEGLKKASSSDRPSKPTTHR